MKLNNNAIKRIPVLPLKDIILFPHTSVPILVGRSKSLKAIKTAKENESQIFILTQKDFNVDSISENDLYKTGVLANIKESIELPDNTIKVLLESTNIAKLKEIYFEDYILADVEVVTKFKYEEDYNKLIALKNTIIASFEQLCKVQKKNMNDLFAALNETTDPFKLVYLICSNLSMKIEIKQQILECFDSTKAIELTIFQIESQLAMINIERKLKLRVRSQVEETQRQYYLNEQMKAIKEELGETGEDSNKQDIKKYEKLIEKVKLTPHAKQSAMSELKKLKNMHPFSAEAGIIKNYLDFILELPWKKYTKMNDNLDEVKKALNNHNFGMEEAKERIYELILQRKRVGNLEKTPVLCFCGSPGTGKTTLAYSIGDAIGYKTIAIPLGGMRDESLLKGHRRTYIAAMPGKILQALKDAGSSNLVIILEEIGSMGYEWKGSPEDVFLEILDNMQNKNFQDHYLGTGFDLSGIIFVATSNTLHNLKPAVVDRLEVINVSGYTLEEKKQICKQYLLPKIFKEYSIAQDLVVFSDEILTYIIQYYTYESGLRELERVLSKIVRKIMVKFESEQKDYLINVDKALVLEYLKIEKYDKEENTLPPTIGVVNGLAYISKREGQEGEILKIEGTLVPGKGGLIETTGRLGETMKESTQVAYKYIVSNAEKYNIDLSIIKEKNIYIHFPSGAVPKDGPSAGLAIAIVIYSCLKQVPVPNDFAITGEISLHDVLKIGGLKEKILAAYRNNNIKRVFIPYANINDLYEIPNYVKEKIKIIPVKTVDELFDQIFN